MSTLEESTAAVHRPMMGVFNKLVIFEQDVPQNTLRSIVWELASGWAWNEEGTELTLSLRQGIKWHDGKPFTAADVKCTIDLLQGTGSEKLRIKPARNLVQQCRSSNPQWRLRGDPSLQAATARATSAGSCNPCPKGSRVCRRRF